MSDTREMTVFSQKTELSVSEVKSQVGKIQELMRSVMKEGEHFGTVPGTAKPALLKPGAEKLGFIFRLIPKYEIKRTDFDNGHREYEIVCSLYHIGSEEFVGQGVGSCSSLESKYRYRNHDKEEPTGKEVPKAYWKNRDPQILGGKDFRPRKVNGKWEVVRIVEREKVENPDIADTYNTILKMAKKRSQVDAMLTACVASDIFTQDVEDFTEVEKPEDEKKAERKKSQTGRKDTSNPPRNKADKKESSTPSPNGQQNMLQELASVVECEFFEKPEQAKAKQKMVKAGSVEERQAVLEEFKQELKKRMDQQENAVDDVVDEERDPDDGQGQLY